MQNSTTEEQQKTQLKSSAITHTISKQDLPISCPLPSASQWNAHPRVFLTLDEDGKATCPYCSTVYILKQDD